MAVHELFDKSGKSPIVLIDQLNSRTPSEGATNTDRGLTHHADLGSMRAEGNSIAPPSSRQLIESAVDDFSFGDEGHSTELTEATKAASPEDKIVEAHYQVTSQPATPPAPPASVITVAANVLITWLTEMDMQDTKCD